MPRVTEEHRQAMKERILSATIVVIGRKGLAGLTIADVIAESGLSAGAIYSYYRGKDELIVGVARRVMSSRREIIAAFARRCPVPSPVDAFTELLEGLPSSWVEGGLFLQIIGGVNGHPGVLDAARGLVGDLRAAITDYLAAYLGSRGLTEENALRRAESATPVAIAIVQGYLLQASVMGTPDLAAYRRGLEVWASGAFTPTRADDDAARGG